MALNQIDTRLGLGQADLSGMQTIKRLSEPILEEAKQIIVDDRQQILNVD